MPAKLTKETKIRARAQASCRVFSLTHVMDTDPLFVVLWIGILHAFALLSNQMASHIKFPSWRYPSSAVHHRQRDRVVARGALFPAHLRPLHRRHGIQRQHRGGRQGEAPRPRILGSGSYRWSLEKIQVISATVYN